MPDYMLFFAVWIGGGLWFFFTNKVSPDDYKRYSSGRGASKKVAVHSKSSKPIPKRKSTKRSENKTTPDEAAKPIRKRKRTNNKSPKNK